MKRIEFIGAPATGKTTLLKTVCAKRTPQDKWLIPEEARVKIAKNLKYTQATDNLLKLMLFCLKNNIFFLHKDFQKIQNRLAGFILQPLEKMVFASSVKDYNIMIDLVIKSLGNPNETPAMKAKRTSYYLDFLVRNVAFFDYFACKDLIVYDEGLIHYASGLNNKKFKEMLDVSPQLQTKIKPAGIIHCKLALEEHFIRRKKRISKGIIRRCENDINSDEQLLSVCKGSQLNAERRSDVMRSAGIQVIDIDTARPPDQNALEIRRFIRRIADLTN